VEFVVAEDEVWLSAFGVLPQAEEVSGGDLVREVREPVSETEKFHLTWDAMDQSVRFRFWRASDVIVDVYREQATLLTIEAHETGPIVVLEYYAQGCRGRTRVQVQPTFALDDRNLRPDEDPSAGLVAKNPDAKYLPAGHIANGSKPNFRSQYISTTADIDVARKWGNGRLVMIDLGVFDGTVIDASTQVARDLAGIRGHTANRLAEASKEVLLVGFVPPEAVTWIGAV
jgi:hypothetical protein